MRLDASHSRRARLLTVTAVWLTFCAYSLLRVPVPGVNEPHYLTKARHYWQPEWCAGDLFLESSNAHLVFYQTVGWLTAVTSLESAAIIGRVIGFLLLAVGWERLVSRLVTSRGVVLLAAWVFLLLQTLGNLSGEWLVGGLESKTFSYGLAMWAGGAALRGRLTLTAILLGLAVSFHPVVGCWSTLCMAGAYAARLVALMVGRKRDPVKAAGEPAVSVDLGRLIVPGVCFVMASAPGVAPALGLLAESDSGSALHANIIQVGMRLKHHLDPLTFSIESYRYFGLLVVLWLVLLRATNQSDSLRPLTWFTISALAVAFVGLLAAIGPRPIQHLPMLGWRLVFLKLYPFRLADVAVPFSVAVAAVAYLDDWLKSGELRRGVRLVVHLGLVGALALAVVIPGRDQNPSRMSPEMSANWLEACRWVNENTPREALIYAHREQWAVKWYAERPEYVNHKDCPQDAAGILEWYRRRRRIGSWIQESAADGSISSEDLAALEKETGIEYLIVRRLGPIDERAVYRNETFRIYRLDSPAVEAN